MQGVCVFLCFLGSQPLRPGQNLAAASLCTSMCVCTYRGLQRGKLARLCDILSDLG